MDHIMFLTLLPLATLVALADAQMTSHPTATPLVPANASFVWKPSEWSECLYPGDGQPGTPMCCSCHRKRNVTCWYKETHEVIAPFYCHKSNSQRPVEKEACDHCVVNCAMSLWSEWTSCSATCGPAYRRRTRQVIHPGMPGGKGCGPVLDEGLCPGLAKCVDEPGPDYQWRSGPWTSCRKKTLCGEGTRYRQVHCVSKQGDLVSDLYCLHGLPDEKKPLAVEQCPTPCDCEVSEWTDWGPCSVTCHQGPLTHGFQVRSRSTRRKAFNGGKICPPLQETRACHVHKMMPCPRFVWMKGNWGPCTTLENAALCGAGEQSREVTCVREDDVTHTAVHHVLCMQDAVKWDNLTDVLPPTQKRACNIDCPKDCQLGMWENWDPCTRSCGPGGIRIRYRPVLVEPDPGGKDCNDRFESSGCDNMPCVWWHTGQWTMCFLENEAAGCGEGKQIRNVYCISALDDVLPDSNCSDAGIKPQTEQRCRRPCTDECVLSEWMEWGLCSASCGPKGGLQSRTRQIIGGGRLQRQRCENEMSLQEDHVCNQKPCKTHMWQVSAWSDCEHLPNATVPCGHNTGIKHRDVRCEMDSGYRVEDKLCLGQEPPAEQELCSAPCPVDCELSEWSEWSECGATCGKGMRLKIRRVISWDRHGGKPCPPGLNQDGVELQRKRCKRLPACHEYEWSVGDWSLCLTLQECGHGVRTRNVSCLRDSQHLHTPDVCSAELEGIAPHSQEVCFRPCPGDCVLSEWSAWTSCSQSCGVQAGRKTRTRSVINADTNLDLSTQCPQLRTEDLTDTQSCGSTTCPSYAWAAGPWTSCIVTTSTQPDSPYACGEGMQRRHVMCRQDNQYDVTSHMCDNTDAIPAVFRSCHVPCPVSCHLSEWTSWTNCSSICGMGSQQRERQVLTPAKNGGRACHHLAENRTCSIRDCLDLEWQPTPWGHCQPLFGMPCGRGQQYRDIVCPAGKDMEAECDKRSRRLSTMQQCDQPCQGDCVMSTWSEWSRCPCGKANATQTRTRQLVKHGLPSGQQCGATAETMPCSCPPYQLHVGPWASCHLTYSNATCGPGVQQRKVNCLNTLGVGVSLSLCDMPPGLALSQPCELPCATDCQLSPVSSWLTCTDSCGMHAYQVREQQVIMQANTAGITCPSPAILVQNTTCASVPCYTYIWQRSPWSTCSNTDKGCGLATQTREITCYRSDGEVVNEATCLNEMKLTALSIRDIPDEDQLLFDLHTQMQCGAPCPGDCQMGDWSDWGACLRNCSAKHSAAFQVRSRAVLKPAQGGQPCPTNLHEFRSCPRDGAICPMFFWRGLPWSNAGKRQVQCLASDTVQVTGGCQDEDRPPSQRVCPGGCPSFSSCHEGLCRCKHGFQDSGKNKLECLPEFGCEADSHCIVNHTFCDVKNKECLCLSGTLPKQGQGCPYVGDANSKEKDAGLASLFLYVLVGSVCALVLISFCLVFLLFKRRRRKRTANGVAKEKKEAVTADPDVTLMYKYSSPGNIGNGSEPVLFGGVDADSYRQYSESTSTRTLPRKAAVPKEVPLTSIYGTGRRGMTTGGQDFQPLPLPPSPPPRGGPLYPNHRVGTSTFKPPEDPPGVLPGRKLNISSHSLPQSPSTYDNLDGGLILNKSEEDLGPPPPVKPRPPNTRLSRKQSPSPQLRSSSPWNQPPDGSSQDIKRHTPEGAITQPNAHHNGEHLPPPVLVSNKPTQPGQPAKRVHYNLPDHDSVESDGEFSSSSSTKGNPRQRNPASARLLEYCDELIAELQTMATN